MWAKKKLADVVSRFSVNWYAVAAPLVVARWEVMLHLGALFLAAGAVAGMYFRDSFKAIKRSGAARSLRANRPSSPLSTRSLVQVSWYPTCSLGLAGEIDVTRLLSPQGDKAAAWIHLFTITVLLIIVIPRAALAAWQWRNIKRRRSDIALRLDPYYGEVIEAPVRALIEKEVTNRANSSQRTWRPTSAGSSMRSASFRDCGNSGKRRKSFRVEVRDTVALGSLCSANRVLCR